MCSANVSMPFFTFAVRVIEYCAVVKSGSVPRGSGIEYMLGGGWTIPVRAVNCCCDISCCDTFPR